MVTTIQNGVVDPAAIEPYVAPSFAQTLIAACGWNLCTWYLGLPTSSSHALIGGLVGATITFTGSLTPLRWQGLGKIVLFCIGLAPIIGFVLGSGIALTVTWLCRRASPRWVDSVFRRGQLLSAAFFSLGHGGNDAQKTMGIIFVLLLGTGVLERAEKPSLWCPRRSSSPATWRWR